MSSVGDGLPQTRSGSFTGTDSGISNALRKDLSKSLDCLTPPSFDESESSSASFVLTGGPPLSSIKQSLGVDQLGVKPLSSSATLESSETSLELEVVDEIELKKAVDEYFDQNYTTLVKGSAYKPTDVEHVAGTECSGETFTVQTQELKFSPIALLASKLEIEHSFDEFLVNDLKSVLGAAVKTVLFTVIKTHKENLIARRAEIKQFDSMQESQQLDRAIKDQQRAVFLQSLSRQYDEKARTATKDTLKEQVQLIVKEGSYVSSSVYLKVVIPYLQVLTKGIADFDRQNLEELFVQDRLQMEKMKKLAAFEQVYQPSVGSDVLEKSKATGKVFEDVMLTFTPSSRARVERNLDSIILSEEEVSTVTAKAKEEFETLGLGLISLEEESLTSLLEAAHVVRKDQKQGEHKRTHDIRSHVFEKMSGSESPKVMRKLMNFPKMQRFVEKVNPDSSRTSKAVKELRSESATLDSKEAPLNKLIDKLHGDAKTADKQLGKAVRKLLSRQTESTKLVFCGSRTVTEILHGELGSGSVMDGTRKFKLATAEMIKFVLRSQTAPVSLRSVAVESDEISNPVDFSPLMIQTGGADSVEGLKDQIQLSTKLAQTTEEQDGDRQFVDTGALDSIAKLKEKMYVD